MNEKKKTNKVKAREKPETQRVYLHNILRKTVGRFDMYAACNCSISFHNRMTQCFNFGEVLTGFYELWSYARSSIKRFNKNYYTFRILHLFPQSHHFSLVHDDITWFLPPFSTIFSSSTLFLYISHSCSFLSLNLTHSSVYSHNDKKPISHGIERFDLVETVKNREKIVSFLLSFLFWIIGFDDGIH